MILLQLVSCRGRVADERRSERPAENTPVAAPALPNAPPQRLYVDRLVANVREAPNGEARRIGYLRAGARLSSLEGGPFGSEGCRSGGWYRVAPAGYICVGREVLVLEGQRRGPRGPAQPVLGDPLPYRYLKNRRDQVPMYRRVPTAEDLLTYEGIGASADGGTDGGVVAASNGTTSDQTPPNTAVVAGANSESAAVTATGEAGEGVAEEVLPPSLTDLEGDLNSVLIRRMMRGFIVSIDRDVRLGGRRYWRTQSSGLVPQDALGSMAAPSEFHGLELSESIRLPVGFVVSSRVSRFVRRGTGAPRNAGAARYHAAFAIERFETAGTTEYAVAGDTLYRRGDIVIVEPRTRPRGIPEGAFWVDVDLTSQSMLVYEGDQPRYTTLFSSGRVNPSDPEHNFPTPTGVFRITAKHITHTMDGDHAVDGPYSIEDVPYVMYFHGGIAFHSAFWHDGFGRPRSHGCVNLSPGDARWLFGWARPRLPDNWHGVYARSLEEARAAGAVQLPDELAGTTYVHVHGETPGSGR